MSFLLQLDMDKLEEIFDLLPKYEKKVKDAEAIFKLDGRRLEEVARTLPHYLANYDQSLQEMKALEEWVTSVRDKVSAKYWKKYIEGYPKQLSTRDVQAYIAGEKEIVELNQIIIEVGLIKNHFAAIVKAFDQMAWMVGHMTKLAVAELRDTSL